MELLFKTKADTTPKGKKYIFMHAMSEDDALRSEIVERILSFEQGLDYCLWYSDEPQKIIEPDEMTNLSEMAVFIPVITDNYFDFAENTNITVTGSNLFETLQMQGIAVLPILENSDLLPKFNRLFGDIHGISLSLPEANRLISEQLERILPDKYLTKKITEEAFSGGLFLSYRKKDIHEAKRIMKAIHDTDAAGAAAIWFDEFLVAGRDFNDEIKNNLIESDAMALAVTPNLLEEGNYVCEVEYPSAVQNNVNILPIEAVQTDNELLSEAYPGISDITQISDVDAIEALLNKVGFQKKDNNPFAEYLLGMAFMVGLHVEKDTERAIRLFTSAAEQDCTEACEQLGMMYSDGYGVKKDVSIAIKYKLKAFNILKSRSTSIENFRQIDKSLWDWNGLPRLLQIEGRFDESSQVEQEFLELVENSPCRDEDECILFRVNVLSDLANLFYEYDLGASNQFGPSESRLDTARTYADKAMKLLDSYQGNDEDMSQFLRSVVLDQYADLAKYRGDLNRAIYYKQMSKEIIEPLAEKTGNLEYLSRSFQVSNNLGLFYWKKSNNDSSSKSEFEHKAEAEMKLALNKARQLEKLNPLRYRAKLMRVLSNCVLTSTSNYDKKVYALECYEILMKIAKDNDVDGKTALKMRNFHEGFRNGIYNIELFTTKKERDPIFEKIYGDISSQKRRKRRWFGK